MKILVTHPSTFHRIRRGTERLAEETAACLAGNGHDVTFLACKPGPTAVTRNAGFVTLEQRSLSHPLLSRIGVHEYQTFGLNVMQRLLTHRYDLVYSFSFVDAWVAAHLKTLTGVPNVFVMNGLPIGSGGRIFRSAIQGSSAVVAFSGFVQRYIQERWSTPSVKIPAPVDLAQFPLSRSRDLDRPIILTTAALDDNRKGGRVLMRAFNLLKRVQPRAVLRVCSRITDGRRAELGALVDRAYVADVQFADDGPRSALADEYGRAAVSVLAACDEAFGMVVTESFACGTPVAGTRHGALPELISNGDVGRLFDPGDVSAGEPTNAEGLAQAIVEAMELSRLPRTPDACRAQADLFSWRAACPLVQHLCATLGGRTLREAV